MALERDVEEVCPDVKAGRKVLTVVASRVTPWTGDRSLRLRFTKDRILVVISFVFYRFPINPLDHGN
ncbi:MAG: hypothetical protein QXZ48_01605 [Zestosphaera sp.]